MICVSSHMEYDAELQRHNDVLRRAYAIRRTDRVLDIGCGTGQTTRDAARLAVAGSALGVDISPEMIKRARRLAETEGLFNVTFEEADAEAHRFPTRHFDVVISRFGTMFFLDPIVAFSNIARGLRAGGRLVMMVWREHTLNEWSVSIERSLAASGSPPTAAPRAPNPFSLADPLTVEQILSAAGFASTDFCDVHEPVYYGANVATALDWVRGFSCTQSVLHDLDPPSAVRVVERLRETLAAHHSERGVWFDSRAWIVTANLGQ
jgi:ubiquinone/menaquinone biosynthesis C-methylase UbiE